MESKLALPCYKTTMKDHLISVFCFRSQTIINQIRGWTGPCGSYYDCKTLSGITIKKLWGKKGLLLMDPEITCHTWGHPGRYLVETERESPGLGFCFYWG